MGLLVDKTTRICYVDSAMGFLDKLLKELQDAEPRDTEGLTTKQKQFLRLRPHTDTDRAALDSIKATWAQFLTWQDDESFMRVYTELVPGTAADRVRKATYALGMDSIAIMERAAKGEELSKEERWFVERIHKVLGLEKTVIESTHTNIPAELRLAILMIERGTPAESLPPGLRGLVQKYLPQGKPLLALSASEPSVVVDYDGE